MLIVDAQTHIWAASTPERPWPARHEPHRPIPFTRDDLLREMNAAGIDRTIIVPPSWEGDRNDLALEAVRLYQDRLAIMGVLDLQAPESPGLIANWRKQPGMLGIRVALRRGHFRELLVQGRVDWLWAEAEKAGVPIMVMIDPEQIPLIDKIAERHPKLKLVMDHLLLYMGAKDEQAFRDLDKVLALARRPNIAVKASSLPSYTNDVYPFKRIHSYIRQVYDAFGPKRMFWGTDQTRMPCTPRQALTLFTEELPWLTADDQEWIMGKAVCEWLNWRM